MMRALVISPVVLACAACVQTAPDGGPRVNDPVRVLNDGQPFRMWEGALARKAADAACGGQVVTSIQDRFDASTGEWVYPGGCA